MSSLNEDQELNKKRRPVHLRGVALLILSFQTLGTIIPFTLLSNKATHVTQALFTPTLVPRLCMSSMQSGPQLAPLLRRRMLSEESAPLSGL
jgi:hypothetical protein